MIYVNKKDKINEHQHGTKVFVYPRKEDAKILYQAVVDMGINKPMDAGEYHVTVIYSSHPCPDAEYHKINLPMVGFINGWEIFESKLGRCLVALIKSTPIYNLNKELVHDYGATSNFPEYKAHMTVSWHHVGDKPDSFPIQSIIFDAYKVDGLDPNWAPK